MSESSGTKYLEALVNASSSKRAWQLVAIAMMAVNVFMAFNMVRMANAAPTRLVPYEFAANHGYVDVDPDGLNADQYLAHIAESDIKLYTDWSRETLDRQYNRFLNRTAPNLYNRKVIELRKEIEQLARAPYSQAFFPTGRTVVGPRAIAVEGNLNRWAGEKLVLAARVKYVLTYSFEGRLPAITDFEIQEISRGGVQ